MTDSDDSEDIPPDLSDEEPDPAPSDAATLTTLTEEVEEWCSSPEFDSVWADCFARCCTVSLRTHACLCQSNEGPRVAR